ncbi:MAG TPA: o-succinylbenzoate synthase [Acidimicrobiales bacterium]|nr:o-succinylbenzoate synthase [Acidimicrobiales bacterium]
MSGPVAARPVRVELRRVALATPAPFASAHGTEHERRSILVRAVDAEGVEGWGECPALARPTYTGEWHLGAWQVLVDEIVPAVLAGEPDPTRGHPMASGAVEAACLDLALRRQGRSLADALGATRAAVDTTEVIGLGTVDEIVARVAAAVQRGHRSVKLKIHPGSDLDPLRAVRATWPDLSVAADANGSYADDLDRLPLLDEVGLTYLEQPLAPDDLVGHATLVARLRTPVALDESASSAGAVAAALALGAADVVNIKPARLGGLLAARRVHDLVVDRGSAAFVGGMLELGVGRAAALAVAALPGCGLPTDLGPSARYVVDDVTEPLVLGPGATLAVPDGPGIGVVPRADRLATVTIESVWLAPS